MTTMFQIIVAATFIDSVVFINALVQSKNAGNQSTGQLNRLIQTLINSEIRFKTRKSNNNKVSFEEAKSLFEALRQHMSPDEIRNWLRQKIDTEHYVDTQHPGVPLEDMSVKNDHAKIVETELKDALAEKTSALLDKPYVEKRGRNDFLVMRPDIVDPFVTIIPNDIYYNAEKKCVNWLDDCSLQGIRARLLQKIRSPYK